MNPKLSLLVPAIPGRPDRLKAILQRTTLAVARYNDKFPEEQLDPKSDFEFVIVDGGSNDHTKDMCLAVGEHFSMKYVYLPIGKFMNAAYPRNVGLRVCEGEVIGHLDVDHYPSENIVEGMLRPFVDGRIDRNINRGYVVDSSKSPDGRGPNVRWLESLNKTVLNQVNLGCTIDSVYREAKIPPPGVNNTLWVYAVKRKYAEDLNGYDENYCRMYVREDDDWRERLLAHGLSFWDGANKLFCAIHLWHPAAWRSKQNQWNKDYFKRVCCPVRHVRRNDGHRWGKMLSDGYSIMNNKYREPADHEKYVAESSTRWPAWEDDPSWESIDDLLKAIDNGREKA